MKKLIIFFTAVFMIVSALAFSACNVECNHIAGDEVVYKGKGNVVEIGQVCTKCDEVVFVQETIPVDYVAATANDVTTIQEKATGDVTILLKKGDHLVVYALARRNGATRIIAEEGARVQTVSLQVDCKGITIENFKFSRFAELTTGSSLGVHLATGTQDIKIYSDVTVKNCTFLDGAYINGAWTKGIANNFVLENNVFDHTDFESTNRCAMQVEEVDGNTIVRNNVFKNICYSALRLGAQGSVSNGYTKVNGTMLIENNVFENIYTYAIQVSALNELDAEVKNNIFNTAKTVRFTKASSNCKLNLTIGPNTWKTIPDTVSNATFYDPREQEVV